MATAAAALLDELPTRPSLRIARFGERHIRHAKDRFAGQPFRLEPWESAWIVEPVYDTLLASGLRRYTEALIGIPKKNGKTHIAALLGAYHLFADGRYRRLQGGVWEWAPTYGAEVYNVAASKEQAKVLFKIATGFVQRDPMLRALTAGHIYKDAIEVPETESVWRVLAADARLAHGPNPSAAIIDELWAHRNEDLYEAFASAGGAREQPLVLTITTAGWDQDSIAFRMYEAGQEKKDPRFYFHWSQAPDGCAIDDRKAWKVANPAKWITTGYLARELKRAKSKGLELQFRRWHLNQWTSTKEMAIPLELWDSGAAKPRIPKGAEVVVAVDSAPKRDTTAVAVDYRDGSGVHHVRVTIMKADPDTGYLDFAALEELIRETARTFDVKRILVDPFNMIRSMVLLAEEELPIEEFPQGDVRMVPASMNLYELLIQERLRHGGSKELRRQVQAAAKQVTERGWRFKKRTSAGNIDGLVAITMAAYELERGEEEEAEPPQPSLFYE